MCTSQRTRGHLWARSPVSGAELASIRVFQQAGGMDDTDRSGIGAQAARPSRNLAPELVHDDDRICPSSSKTRTHWPCQRMVGGPPLPVAWPRTLCLCFMTRRYEEDAKRKGAVAEEPIRRGMPRVSPRGRSVDPRTASRGGRPEQRPARPRSCAACPPRPRRSVRGALRTERAWPAWGAGRIPARAR